MLAGGMVVAAPSMVPTAAAAGALYVSAENAAFDNLFGGPMVVEVIVKDPNRSRTDIASGEPTVLVDNQRLRLAQGIDGNWYGYFADNTDVTTVHALTTASSNYPLMFGTDDEPQIGGATDLTVYSANTYRAIATSTSTTGGDGTIDNPPALSNHNSTLGVSTACIACGQIGILSTDWPFLQTFDFTQGDFDVKYEQAGNDEIYFRSQQC